MQIKDQEASILVTPGFSTVIFPAQIHMVLLDCNMAAFPPIFNFLATGLHGIIGMGMHEPGTKTGTGPAIFQFIGFAGDLHVPKAGIFSMGIKSISVARGLVLPVIAIAKGKTSISLAPAPNVHFILAPIQTHFGIQLN